MGDYPTLTAVRRRSMPVPDYQSLMLPLLKLAALGETRVPDTEDKLADEFG